MASATTSDTFDPKSVLDFDPWLKDCVPAVGHRYDVFKKWKDNLLEHEGGYDKFSKGYEKFRLNVNEKGEITYREWAPNAVEAVLIGDFSE